MKSWGERKEKRGSCGLFEITNKYWGYFDTLRKLLYSKFKLQNRVFFFNFICG